MRTVSTFSHRAEVAAQSPWVDRAARFGLVAKAVVHAIIGWFALKVALGDGGALLGGREATQKVGAQPFGDVLLVVLGVGLACYALWRLTQAIVDPEGRRRGGRAAHLAVRIGRAASGVVYAGFALGAFQTAFGAPSGRGSWVHAVLQRDGGPWLVIALGLAVIAAGIYHLVRAYRADVADELDLGRMSAREQRWAVRVGRFGLAARGVVLGIAGWLLVEAGRQVSAEKAKGTSAALRELAQQAWGSVLLGVIAAGLLAYAVHLVVCARFRRPS